MARTSASVILPNRCAVRCTIDLTDLSRSGTPVPLVIEPLKPTLQATRAPGQSREIHRVGHQRRLSLRYTNR